MSKPVLVCKFCGYNGYNVDELADHVEYAHYDETFTDRDDFIDELDGGQ